MRVNVIVLCVLFLLEISHAQTPEGGNAGPMHRANSLSVYGGMGIALAAAPAMVNYINTLADPTQQVQTFATAVEFFGGAALPVNESWEGGIEYSYLFKSYDLPTAGAGTYTVFYDLNMPSLTAHYVTGGNGYFLKFGGAVGYHGGSVEQKSSFYGTDSTFTAHGVGIKADAVGQTAFDDHLYAYIGGSMRWELMGSLKDSQGDILQNHGQSASLSMFAVELAFGLTYYF
jgi:hypothetical protein